MVDAFHVTATQQPTTGQAPIAIGTVVELEPAPAVYSPGAGAELARLFPDGLTFHGRRYMTQFNPEGAAIWVLESPRDRLGARWASIPSTSTCPRRY